MEKNEGAASTDSQTPNDSSQSHETPTQPESPSASPQAEQNETPRESADTKRSDKQSDPAPTEQTNKKNTSAEAEPTDKPYHSGEEKQNDKPSDRSETEQRDNPSDETQAKQSEYKECAQPGQTHGQDESSSASGLEGAMGGAEMDESPKIPSQELQRSGSNALGRGFKLRMPNLSALMSTSAPVTSSDSEKREETSQSHQPEETAESSQLPDSSGSDVTTPPREGAWTFVQGPPAMFDLSLSVLPGDATWAGSLSEGSADPTWSGEETEVAGPTGLPRAGSLPTTTTTQEQTRAEQPLPTRAEAKGEPTPPAPVASTSQAAAREVPRPPVDNWARRAGFHEDGTGSIADSGCKDDVGSLAQNPISPFLVVVRNVGNNKIVSIWHEDGSNSWTNVPVPPENFHMETATVIFRRLLVESGGAGVRDDRSMTFSHRTVRTLDVDTYQWGRAPSMRCCRGYHGMAVLSGAIYVLGGENDQFKPTRLVEKFSETSVGEREPPDQFSLHGGWVEEGELLMPLRKVVAIAAGRSIYCTAENAIDVHVFHVDTKTAVIVRLGDGLLGCDMRVAGFSVGDVAVFLGKNGRAHPIRQMGRHFFAYRPMYLSSFSSHSTVSIFLDKDWVRVLGARQYRQVEKYFQPQGDWMLSHNLKSSETSRTPPYAFTKLVPPQLDKVFFVGRGDGPVADHSYWLRDRMTVETEVLDTPVHHDFLTESFTPKKRTGGPMERVLVLGHNFQEVPEILMWTEGDSSFQTVQTSVYHDAMTRGWAAAVLLNTVVISGGQNPSRVTLQEIYVLKVRDMTLTRGPDMREGRWGHASTSVRGSVYVAGGVGERGMLRSVEQLGTDEWRVVGHLAKEVTHCACGVVSARWIVVAGNECDLQVYDTHTGTASELKLPETLASSIAYGLTADRRAWLFTEAGLLFQVEGMENCLRVSTPLQLEDFNTRRRFGVLCDHQGRHVRIVGGLEFTKVGRFYNTRYRRLHDVYTDKGKLDTTRGCMPSLPKNFYVNGVFSFVLPESDFAVNAHKSCLKCKIS